MPAEVLTHRALNRATLARQLLLERSSLSPIAAVEHLVGLQAQNPLDPYLALWSRLEGFDPLQVGRLVETRELVRIVVMRGTIHLVTADDAAFLRPLTQPVLDMEITRHREYAPELVGVDLSPVMAFAWALLAERPMATPALRAALAERFPDLHAAALAYACRCVLPLVQVPPRGVWGKKLQVTLTPLDAWTGRPLRPDASIDEAVLRYLAAFGPATVADVAAWSRLTGFKEVAERLRPKLRAFTDANGREVLDLPDAPRPDPATPAPVRYLPEYDNVLLSHADRSRFAPLGGEGFDRTIGPAKGTVLVDGTVRAIWRVELDKVTGRATAVVEHHRLAKRALAAVEAEGARAIRFWQPAAPEWDVRLRPIT
jgi:hypothetical protein